MTIMDGLTLAAVIAGTILLTTIAVIACQYDTDTTHQKGNPPMTAPQDHPYQTSTPAFTQGEPGSPPVTNSEATNIIASKGSSGVSFDAGD